MKLVHQFIHRHTNKVCRFDRAVDFLHHCRFLRDIHEHFGHRMFDHRLYSGLWTTMTLFGVCSNTSVSKILFISGKVSQFVSLSVRQVNKLWVAFLISIGFLDATKFVRGCITALKWKDCISVGWCFVSIHRHWSPHLVTNWSIQFNGSWEFSSSLVNSICEWALFSAFVKKKS